MLRMVCHLWFSGAHFVLYCYSHHYLLVLRNRDGTANIIYSREGVTQGYPLAMVAYGFRIIPLIKRLKLTYPDIT